MKRHRRFISLVAIFGLMMFVSTSWLQPASAAAANIQTVGHHKLSLASSTSTSYLAEVKHRIPNNGSSGSEFLVGVGFFAPQKSPKSLLSHLRTSECASPSLWLLNRSLLI